MANESDVQLFSGGTGPLLRTINVYTMIGGQLTQVQMEVAAISDPDGNIITVSELRNIPFQRAILRELRALRIGQSHQLGENLIELAKSEDDWL